MILRSAETLVQFAIRLLSGWLGAFIAIALVSLIGTGWEKAWFSYTASEPEAYSEN